MVTVELFGTARLCSGVSQVEVQPGSLQEVLCQLEHRLPQLRGVCIRQGKLLPGYMVNINGQRFTRDPHYRVGPGDVVLLLSADAGGA